MSKRVNLTEDEITYIAVQARESLNYWLDNPDKHLMAKIFAVPNMKRLLKKLGVSDE